VEEREKCERETAGTVMRVMEEIVKREVGSQREDTSQSDVATAGAPEGGGSESIKHNSTDDLPNT
jgi:hypothetical protein